MERRQFLGMSGLGALGALWSNWGRVESAAPRTGRGRAKSVILIFNCGAPSHLDLWDMKPDAPDTVRGEFRPMATRVPGIHIGELMPRLAPLADRYSIVRTVHHTHTQHNSGMYWSIAGRPYRIDSTLINPGPTDVPSVGTLVGWLAKRDGWTSPLPPYVITPAPHCDSLVYLTPGQYGGCLGRRFDPFVLNADPNAADFRIPNLSFAPEMDGRRLAERRALLEGMGGTVGTVPVVQAHGQDMERAFTLTTSGEMRRAFDLSREPVRIREMYGRHTWGQSHLLARRLVEAGVRFVTTVNGQSIVWDTHQDNFGRMKNTLVPPMERAFAALLEDLEQRGLLDTTLVVWMGDFGRTPTINKDAGRDHWPPCYSVVLAGGGIRGGVVVGESDRIGAYPKTRPVTPADIHATIYAALGYDAHGITFLSAEGRPFPLTEGEPIRELFA